MKTIERGDVVSGKRKFFDHRNLIVAGRFANPCAREFHDNF